MRTESRTRQQASRGGQPGQRGARRGSDAGLPPGWALQASPRRPPRGEAAAADEVPAGPVTAGRRLRPAGAARGPGAPARDPRARDPQARSVPGQGTAQAPRPAAPGRPGRGARPGPIRASTGRASTGRTSTGQPGTAQPGRSQPRTGRSRLRPPAPRGLQQLRPGAGQPGARTVPARATAPAGTARPAGSRRLGGPRTPFVLLVLSLLGGGLVCLLVINTTLGAASFQISNLQKTNATLSQQQQALQQQIAREQSPNTIAHRAYQLGMRQQQHLTFLNARTGHIYRAPLKMAGVTYQPPGYTP